jgi:predicted transcriptional regulator
VQRRGAPDVDVRGNLQAEIMASLWRLGEGTVGDIHRAQPESARRAYTTLQTVMNRLVKHGLLERERRGRSFVYRPRHDEVAILTGRIHAQFASASADARRAALLELVGRLDPGELDDVARCATRIKRARRDAG